MINTIGTIAGILFFLKIIAHLFLILLIEKDLNLLDYGTQSSPKIMMVGLLPYMGEVPREFRFFKIAINILYTISFVGIIVFLIGINI